MQVADKPARPHWRDRDGSPPGVSRGPVTAGPAAGKVNPVTGKAAPGRKFAASTRAHAETVLRHFYDFHLESGRGPIVNPFPLDRSRRSGRAHAHHNPLEPFRHERTGRYRPKLPKRIPRRIPDEQFNQIFAGLKCHRDRALLAFWVSTGARAEELLDSLQDDVRPGDQLISVTRKGSRAVQELPASPDAFVWLRLYQEEIWRKGAPRGRRHPLWFTLRRPFRSLTYHAARAMFTRVNNVLGTNWSLHDLRHTAAYRMARDPGMPITDVIFSFIFDHGADLGCHVEDDVVDVAARGLCPPVRSGGSLSKGDGDLRGHQGGSCCFGESRRRSPSACASCRRSWSRSVRSLRICSLAASRRRSSEASEVRWRAGIGGDGARRVASRRRSICWRMSLWV